MLQGSRIRQVVVEETPEFRRAVEQARAGLTEAGTRYVHTNWVDIHGRSKGKAVPIERLDNLARGSELFTVGAMDGMGPLGPNEDECAALPDLRSLVVCPWDKGNAWVACDLWLHGRPYPYDSRFILKQVLDQARAMGYGLDVGVEAEFYILREGADGMARHFLPSEQSMVYGYDVESTLDAMPFLDRVIQCMQELGWDIIDFDQEGGNSQYEINFTYSDALTAADRVIFLRLMLKEIAKRFGAFVTFMPKPFSDDFGSAANYNMNLVDSDSGKNLFEDGDDSRGLGFSELAYHFIGGMLKHAQAITAVAAPTVNSYKRLVGQGYMSTITWAGVHAGYGDNNRTCMLRLPGNRRCIETRASDVSSNPYLAIAMMLAAGLEGIKEGIDPGKPVTEDMTRFSRAELAEQGIETLPGNLLDATRAFDIDPLSDEVFGGLKKVFVEQKRREWDEYHNWVSQWERTKYLRLF